MAPVFVFADCSKTGTTVVYINGIWQDEAQAKADKQDLEYQYKIKGKNNNITFVNGFNPSHVAGIDDLVNSVLQAYGNNGVDYDLTNILLQLHKDLKTQKILLVGHSQGTFYTNATYDYLIKHGVDKNSIAVYNVATPANKVSGNGKYLTSSTDEVINNVVRILAVAGSANRPLPANINIKIPESVKPVSESGHSFSEVYLGLAPDRIISDMDSEIDNLSAVSDKSQCFVSPKTNIIYNFEGGGYKTIDEAVTYFSQSTTSPFKSPAAMTAFASSALKELSGAMSGVKSKIFPAKPKPVAVRKTNTPDKNSRQNLASAPILTDGNQQNSNIILIPQENLQDRLDDMQEKADILERKIQDLISANSRDNQPEKSETDKTSDEKKDRDKNQIVETIAINNKYGFGGAKVNYPKILISEVQVSPIAQRFVELYNPNPFPVYMTGWYLQRKDANDTSWGTFVPSGNFDAGTIPGNSYFLISKQIPGSDILSDITLSNDNSLALKNPNGDISDKIGFGSAKDPEGAPTLNPAAGKSAARKFLSDPPAQAGGTEQDTDNNLNDFEAGAPTPKKQNFAVDAAPELSSIAITTPATKLNYTVGESLDITGMIVTGTYSDASSKIEPVIPGNITGFDSSKPATGEVLTITIGGPDRNLYNQCKQFRKSKFSRNC